MVRLIVSLKQYRITCNDSINEKLSRLGLPGGKSVREIWGIVLIALMCEETAGRWVLPFSGVHEYEKLPKY